MVPLLGQTQSLAWAVYFNDVNPMRQTVQEGRYPGQGIDSLTRAACHACALLPETSCEEDKVANSWGIKFSNELCGPARL